MRKDENNIDDEIVEENVEGDDAKSTNLASDNINVSDESQSLNDEPLIKNVPQGEQDNNERYQMYEAKEEDNRQTETEDEEGRESENIQQDEKSDHNDESSLHDGGESKSEDESEYENGSEFGDKVEQSRYERGGEQSPELPNILDDYYDEQNSIDDEEEYGDEEFDEYGQFGDSDEYNPIQDYHDEEYQGDDDGSLQERQFGKSDMNPLSMGGYMGAVKTSAGGSRGHGYIKPQYAYAVDDYIQHQIAQNNEEELMDDSPVTVEELNRWWHIIKRHPIGILLRIKKKLNFKVRAAILTSFTGYTLAAIHIAGMKLVDTIGAILNCIEGPIGAIGFGISARDILNFILRLPVLKQTLMFLRKHILPLIRKSALFIKENQQLYNVLVLALERECPELFT